jgi:uncharacterized protein (TIGR03435 family)
MTSRNIVIAVALVAVAGSSQTKCALTPAVRLNAQGSAFEVASVKPNQARVRQSMTMNPGGVAYTSVSMIDILVVAYGVKRYQITGPDWLGSERYDINATTGRPATSEQIKAMLQTLVADRFKLSLHREKKEQPVFAILIGKKGPRLKAADPTGERGLGPAPGGLAFTNTTMKELADFLSMLPTIHRPVFDNTGLTGHFDFAIRVTANAGDQGAEATKVAMAQAEPSVFADALDALGLKLDSQKAAIDMLVVDRAEKTPTPD